MNGKFSSILCPLNEWKQVKEVQVLNAGGKPNYPKKNLWKQVWTGNQMDIQRRDWELNPGSVVHSAGEVPLLYLLPHEKIKCISLFHRFQVCHLSSSSHGNSHCLRDSIWCERSKQDLISGTLLVEGLFPDFSIIFLCHQ